MGETYSVQESVALNLWTATASVVDVVTLHSDHVSRAIKIDSPVVVAITCSGVVGDTVDFRVGNGDTVRSAGAEDNVLTANKRSLLIVSEC